MPPRLFQLAWSAVLLVLASGIGWWAYSWSDAAVILCGLAAWGLVGAICWLWTRRLGLWLYRPLMIQGLIFVGLILPLVALAITTALSVETPPPGLLTGAIGGSTVAVGWIVSSLFRQYEALAEMDRERIMVMTALREEVFVVFEQFDAQDLLKIRETTRALLDGAGPVRETRPRGRFPYPASIWLSEAEDAAQAPYHPFPTTPSETVIFRSVGSKIYLLDSGVSEPVIRFYAAYSELAEYTQDFRSDRMRSLPVDRRLMAFDLLENRREAVLLTSYKALGALNDGLRVEKAVKTSGKNDALLRKEGLLR